jgi:hypothetical protein
MKKDAPSFNLAMDTLNVRLEQFIPLLNFWTNMTTQERSEAIDYHYEHTTMIKLEEDAQDEIGI